jgi:NitT/TauT family transport system permease protein
MKKYLPSLVFFLFLMALWELIVRIFGIESYILPAPTDIGKAFQESYGLLWSHSLQTVYEALLGFALSCVTGICLALLMV